MSHFSVAVILPKRRVAYVNGSIEREVTRLMAPFDENGEWFADGSRWDWWVVGGRWDGEITGIEHEPVMEPCSTCGGSGIRPGGLEQFGPEWVSQMNGCNGCHGEGKREKWFDDSYHSTDKNVTTMGKVALDYTPYAFITPDGEWHETSRMGWFGAEIEDEAGLTKTDKISDFDQAWAAARNEMANHVVVGLDAHV